MQISNLSSNVQNISYKAAENASGIGEESSFWDFLDIVNPLQHIPILSSLYRSISGDEISAAANIAGGTLFGGPIGGGIAAASEIAEEAIGSDEKQVALAETSRAVESYKKIRVTTQDWLNPNFGNSQIA